MAVNPPAERHYVAPLIRDRVTGEGVQLQTLRNLHLSIMDYMLANPTVPQWAVANYFGRTQSWLSTIINSDLFQLHYHERRKLIEDDQKRNINARIFEMAEKGLGKLIAGLDDDEVSVSEKRAITRLALEAQGALAHGSKGPAVVVQTVQNNVGTANADAVNEARERILNKSRLAHSVGLADATQAAAE